MPFINLKKKKRNLSLSLPAFALLLLLLSDQLSSSSSCFFIFLLLLPAPSSSLLAHLLCASSSSSLRRLPRQLAVVLRGSIREEKRSLRRFARPPSRLNQMNKHKIMVRTRGLGRALGVGRGDRDDFDGLLHPHGGSESL
ncbi:hypothetical protein GmHk_18G052002 [Glycine max]|nr:hypothetical protein GmHk_18G052002 [Glycine max]